MGSHWGNNIGQTTPPFHAHYLFLNVWGHTHRKKDSNIVGDVWKWISVKVQVRNILFLLKWWSIDKVIDWYLISDRQIEILYTVWTADRFTRWKTKSNVMQNRRNLLKKNRKAVLPALSSAVWGSVELEKLLFWVCAHGFRSLGKRINFLLAECSNTLR